MVVKKETIQFQRRSRYEDILDIVNDNEEALKPFTNRDAVCYKASNKGSRFDGRDHLDKLTAEQRRINERMMRDNMMREYASDNNLTHRAQFTPNDSPSRAPQRFDIGDGQGSTIEELMGVEEGDLNEMYSQNAIDTAIARAQEQQAQRQQDIVMANREQLQEEQAQGDGILHGMLSRGGQMAGNVVAGLASGQDLGTSVATGVGVPLLTDMGRLLLNRMLPQPPAPDPEPLHIQYLRPTINLETHQPNVGAIQQPLPAAQQPMALPAPGPQPSTTMPTYSEWSQTAEEPQRRSTAKQSFEKAKTPQKKAKATPAPNFQEGGASSSSGGNAPQPQERTEETDRKGSRKTIKQNVKEAQEETSNMTLLKPSKIGIQTLRETFEEANNRNTMAKTTYKKYRSVFNNWGTRN